MMILSTSRMILSAARMMKKKFLLISAHQFTATGQSTAVLVGTSIKPDSNASVKDKRPKYFTPQEGAFNLNFCNGNVWRVMER